MQPKLLKLGSALTVAAAFLNATTAPAAAGGYDTNAALINTYIQSAPWTSYGKSYGQGYKSYDHAPYKHVSHGWKPYYDGQYGGYYGGYDDGRVHYGGHYYDKPYYEAPARYVSTLGHGTVTYYDSYGGSAYYGDPAFAKRTTIVHPTVKHDGYGHVHHHDAYMDDASYGDDHVLHVGKHATDIRNPVFFASGSSTLSYEAKQELDEIGKIISAYYFGHPKVLILLSGFTDAAGTQSANEALAKARNHAVKDYLAREFGFDKARFVLRAVGEEYANMSGMPYDDNQRKVTVSLIGLPKSATDKGHRHETPAMADGHEMTEPAPDPAPDPALDPALDKGELAPAEEQAMASPEPTMKPMPKPAHAGPMKPAQGGYMQGGQVQAAYMKPVTRCYVPTGPHAGTYVDGKLLATLFTSIDDYGGGKLEEVCGLRY